MLLSVFHQPAGLLTRLLVLCTLLLGIASASSRDMTRPGLPHGQNGYALYAAGYTGDVVPLTFFPPATLRRSGAALSNATGTSPSWITFAATTAAATTKGSAAESPTPHVSGLIRAYITDESAPGRVYTVEAEHAGANFEVRGSTAGYSTGGDGPVASYIDGACLYIANYDSGSASVLALGHDGVPTQPTPAFTVQYTRSGTGPVADRQDQSYAHHIVASPDGGWIYVCDLGADQIHRFRAAVAHNDGSGCAKAAPDLQESTAVPAGSGPRHLAFYYDATTKKQYAYLTSELTNTLTAFVHDPITGALHVIGKPILSAPPGTPLGRGNNTEGPQRTTAELALSPDGAFVYVSNRGDATEDHISIFTRDAFSGAITFRNWVPSGGLMPRHFSLSDDAQYAAVAHQTTGNVVVLTRDMRTGDLRKTGAVVAGLDQVAFAGFVPAARHPEH